MISNSLDRILLTWSEQARFLLLLIALACSACQTLESQTASTADLVQAPPARVRTPAPIVTPPALAHTESTVIQDSSPVVHDSAVRQVSHIGPVEPAYGGSSNYSVGGHAVGNGGSYPVTAHAPSCNACNQNLPPSLPVCPCQALPGPALLDELLCNGGDQEVAVRVRSDWSVHGLNPGDTVAHYDTLSGEVRVTPSNEVCLYSPRFASVRKVYGPVLFEQQERGLGLEQPRGPALSAETQEANAVLQPLEPIRQLATNGPQLVRERVRDIGVENLQAPALANKGFLPYEDLLLVRRGIFDNSEKARLSESTLAAVTWTSDQAPQVLIKNIQAIEQARDQTAESVHVYEVRGEPALRIVKLASKGDAMPGEIVHFTLRFDNVGSEEIGNVTIIDNLNTRLEYIEGTQECTLDANFMTQANQVDSQTLRWEIIEPMQVGDGGIIRFQCRVR